jgi:hypothetical protein
MYWLTHAIATVADEYPFRYQADLEAMQQSILALTAAISCLKLINRLAICKVQNCKQLCELQMLKLLSKLTL